MALLTRNLFGEVIDKVARSVQIAKMFEPEEGYILAYSGGRDSICTEKILEISGVCYEKHYNVTTVDPPELVRFIISQHDTVIYDMPDGTHKYYATNRGPRLLSRIAENEIAGRVIHFNIPDLTMRELIIKKQYPPTRLARYCCEYLKESSNAGRITVTGVRRAESNNRKQNQGPVLIFDGKIGKLEAEKAGVNFTKTARGGGCT